VEQVGEAPALLALSVDAMRAPTMTQLKGRVRELQEAGLEYADLEYEIHDRISRAVVAPALAILAVISVVGPLRSSRRSSRLVLGVVTGFVLSMCRDAAHTMVAVFGFSPAAMAWSPALLLLVAVAAIARSMRPRVPVVQMS
jgi:lipopolysaccharide export LptBFGC system permease protein LptF